MSQLNLTLFGSFQATLNQTPITNFRSAKIQGLLVFLSLTSDQAHSREELAALFWPDVADAAAKKNLRQSLYRLRQLLGDSLGDSKEADRPFLLINRTAVQWNQTSQTNLDVANFLNALERDALEEAIALYAGELLPSFSCDSEPFDGWLQQERERLHRLNLNALSTLAEQNLVQADYKKAEAFARQQLALIPWREEAHRQLMQALMLAGERSAAVAQYERCRTILEAELGIEPSAETQTLANTIARQANKSSGLKSTTREGQPFQGQPPRAAIPFVGRQAEFEQLVTTFRRMSHDGLQLVTILGSAGIGKTRLAEQFSLWATTQGADALRGRAYETTTDLSYQPIIQLFRQRLELENAPEDLLSDLWLSQLTRLWPELRERYPDLPEPTQDETVGRQHLFEAIARLGLALAKRAPLVLFIDDGQWLDSASLDALQYAVTRWSEQKAQILLLLTVRQEALPEFPEAQQWLTRLKRHGTVSQLTLSGLSEQETNRLIGQMLGVETGKDEAPAKKKKKEKDDTSLAQFSQWLFTETAGQPLFLTEALKALVDEGLVVQPVSAGASWQIDWDKLQKQEASIDVWQGVQEIVRGWLRRLSDPAASLLAAAAVLVETASFDHLYQVAGLDEMGAITALDECLGRQMLVEANQGLQSPTHNPIYSFAHQKISDVVYAEAGAARRRILHRRAFLVLQETTAPAGECAHHALRAGLKAESVHYSLKAGQEAMAALATRVALTHYATAWQLVHQSGWSAVLSNPDWEALYLGLGHAYELCEQAKQARDVYEEMVAYAQQNGEASMEWRGLNLLAELYNYALLDSNKAFAALEQAWLVAERSGDRRGMAETAQLLSEASSVQHVLSEGPSAQHLDNERKYAQQALALAYELEEPGLLASCSRRLTYVYARHREWEKGGHYGTLAQKHYEAIGNFMRVTDTQRLVGMCQMHKGFPQQSLETLKKVYAFAQQIENDWEQAIAAREVACTLLELGQYGQAIELIQEAINKAQKVNHPLVAFILTTAQVIYRSVFAFDASHEAGLACASAVANGGHNPYPDLVQAELCAVYALKGEWANAYDHAKQVVAFQEGSSLPPMGMTSWFETEALLRGGEVALAPAEVERVAKAIGDNRRYRLPLLRSRAVLAQWDGDAAQAIVHLEAALALAQEIGLPGEEWPILGELGKLYGENGNAEKSQEAYGNAGSIIHKLADTIDDEGLRDGFLSATLVRSVLNINESGGQ